MLVYDIYLYSSILSLHESSRMRKTDGRLQHGHVILLLTSIVHSHP